KTSGVFAAPLQQMFHYPEHVKLHAAAASCRVLGALLGQPQENTLRTQARVAEKVKDLCGTGLGAFPGLERRKRLTPGEPDGQFAAGAGANHFHSLVMLSLWQRRAKLGSHCRQSVLPGMPGILDTRFDGSLKRADRKECLCRLWAARNGSLLDVSLTIVDGD